MNDKKEKGIDDVIEECPVCGRTKIKGAPCGFQYCRSHLKQ